MFEEVSLFFPNEIKSKEKVTRIGNGEIISSDIEVAETSKISLVLLLKI